MRFTNEHMRRVHWFVCICLFLTVAADARSEVVDRIVAVVEGQLITLSDLRQERAIRAQLGDRPVEDDRILAGQLVDTYLIERQIADYPNIDVTASEVEERLAKLDTIQAPPSDRLREVIRRRIRLEKFVDIKFRPLARPTDDQVRKYYEEVFVPEARQRGLETVPPVTDAEMAKAIRENLVQERMDHEMEGWLEAIRRRSNVQIFN